MNLSNLPKRPPVTIPPGSVAPTMFRPMLPLTSCSGSTMTTTKNQTVAVGKTSITVRCEVRARETHDLILAIDKIVFVALNSRGQPIKHRLAREQEAVDFYVYGRNQQSALEELFKMADPIKTC